VFKQIVLVHSVYRSLYVSQNINIVFLIQNMKFISLHIYSKKESLKYKSMYDYFKFKKMVIFTCFIIFLLREEQKFLRPRIQ
jgi:hypothetical protein